MKLELKAIKYAAFASEETHCYSAKLFVDGKHVADVSNDGHGGADYTYWKDGAHVTEKQVDAWLKENRKPYDPIGDGKCVIHCDVEIECGNLVNAFLTDREVNKAMRDMTKKVLTVDDTKVAGITDIGYVNTFSWKGLKKVEQRHIESIRKDYPNRIILNCLPASEARALIKQSISA